MSVVSDEPLELKFRLADGSDIGPTVFRPEMTIATIKESIISQWPNENGPKAIEEITLINAGRPLDNSKTLAESRVPVAEIPGTPLTMHVVVHPALADKQGGGHQQSDGEVQRCGCIIL